MSDLCQDSTFFLFALVSWVVNFLPSYWASQPLGVLVIVEFHSDFDASSKEIFGLPFLTVFVLSRSNLTIELMGYWGDFPVFFHIEL